MLGLLCFLAAPAWAGPDLQESIRVRIQKDAREITLNGVDLNFGEGEHRLHTQGLGRWRVSWNSKASLWTVASVSSGIAAVDRAGAASASATAVGTAGGRTFRTKTLRVQGSALRSAFASFPDRLLLQARGGSFDLIGDVDFRTYLAGVVSHEMPVSWPVETLKAQVIAARSYALAVRHERRKLSWQVEATVDDQVFRHLAGNAVARVKDAVKETDGQILSVGGSGGRVLKAFYHADCGGRTARSSTVWGAGPDTGTVVDATCPLNPKAHWQFRLSVEELGARLRKNLGKLHLLGLALIPDRFDGRVGIVRLRTELGDQDMKAADFRMAVGAQEIKSTRFDISEDKGIFEFRGRGFGHGVGLCQWGSKALGLKGLSAEKILAHYYPKASVVLGR
jgi:stage II sporulation protein D